MRVHTFFLLLALVCLGLGFSDTAPHPLLRGFALFLVLCSAVLVREIARLLVAAWLA